MRYATSQQADRDSAPSRLVGREARRVARELGHDTQQQAISAARRTLKNSRGGELAVKGRDGRVRAQGTIAPGNDPRSSRG